MEQPMPDDRKKQVRFADCYVLTNLRIERFIISFLDAFVPNRQEYTRTYEIPQFSEQPVMVLSSAEELMGYLEQNRETPHAIYWSNTIEENLYGAMCIFTTDGQVILGLICKTAYPDVAIETEYLNKLMGFCNSNKGLIEYEKPAAQDTAEFLERLRLYSQISLKNKNFESL
jgi:hypothetical protein